MNLQHQKLPGSFVRPLTNVSIPATLGQKTDREAPQRATGRREDLRLLPAERDLAASGYPAPTNYVTGKAEFSALHVMSLSARIAAPTSTTYERWCQYTELPHFMRPPGLVEDQESRMVWRLRAWNESAPWLAATSEIVPGRLIAWVGHPGPLHQNRGRVTFEPMDSEGAETRVTVTLELGDIPAGGVWLEAMATLVEATLAHFSRSMNSPTPVIPLAA